MTALQVLQVVARERDGLVDRDEAVHVDDGVPAGPHPGQAGGALEKATIGATIAKSVWSCQL